MIAIYAGSFDPITLGHLDIIQRLATNFDFVDIAVGISPFKSYLFSQDERINLIKEEIEGTGLENVEPIKVNKLLVDYIQENYGTTKKFIVKGLRHSQDLDYELQSLDVVESAKRGIETMFMFSNPEFKTISSSGIKIMLREKSGNQDLILKYVSKNALKKLKAKIP